MKVNIYTLDINHMRQFLFSRLGTQLFLVGIAGCLFFNIAIEPSAAPPAEPTPKASEAEQGVADRATFMDDYRDVEGIKVAHHIVQKIEDQVLSDSRVTQVILNAEEIDESVLQKPE